MFVVGFDVSLARTGWCVLDYETGDIADGGCGLIVTDPEASLVARLRQIAKVAGRVVGQFPGADVALEQGVSHRNGATTRKLAMAWAAVALEVDHGLGVEPFEVNVGTVKRVATGRGNASKGEVTAAAVARWGAYVDDPDIADAAWVAEVLRRDLIGKFGASDVV